MKRDRAFKILIVEDSKESMDLICFFLQPAGYELITASDGIKALEIISQDQPDLIILDVMLPGKSGYEICERLKKDRLTFHIPIVMITALPDLKDKIRGLESGADDFITKPFEGVELLTRVKSLLRQKDYHDQLIEKNRILNQQKKALEREDELKKRLTDLIVHDMKSPLFVIQGNLQMMGMMQEQDATEEKGKYTERIGRSAERMLRMILNLLDVSRLEQGTMEVEPIHISLAHLLRSRLENFKSHPQHNQKKIVFHPNEALPYARIDRPLFDRVLNNLLNCVFDNTPEKGEIFVDVYLAVNAPDMIEIRIQHQGMPIPPEYHEKIFDKYAILEINEAGLKRSRGLGLVMCKLGINANNGSICIDPTVADGVGYILKIPAAAKNGKLVATPNGKAANSNSAKS